jgi:perilipin-4
MRGHWPPGWDDPDDNIPGEAGEPGTEAEARLSEVAAYLASVPAPLMPGSVEARISAALAVEAASRAGLTARTDGLAPAQEAAEAAGAEGAEGAAGPRVLGPVPARMARARSAQAARVRRRGAHGQRSGRRNLGQVVLGSLAACLLLAFIGFGLSHVGSSSSSSSANSAAGAPAAGSAGAAGSKYAPVSSAAASAPMAVTPAAAGASAGFVVSATGTRYQQATLAQQAQAQLLAAQAFERVPSAAPTASSSSSAASSGSGAVGGYAPSPQLRACVLKVTDGALPKLVDRATYRGTPVYIIATSTRVWVVGLGCTAAKPQVITSQPLAG